MSNLSKSFHAWRNRCRLAYERETYLARFKQLGLAMPSKVEICAQIEDCFPNELTKRKGELHLLAIYHSYNWEEHSLGPALAAFGEVKTIDWRDSALAGGLSPDEPGWMQAMNAGLLQTVQAWTEERPFDVVFSYLSGGQMSQQTMQQLRAFGVPMVNLALNDKETFVGRVRHGHAMGARDICRYFDLCWTSTEDALPKYLVEGALPFYLPEGANPEVHRPYDEEMIYDVSFVGQCYGNRPEVIARLREVGVEVEAFGPGWPSGPLSMEEMVRTWSRSCINLGFGGVLGHNETYCLKGRDFEVPMSGGLYLTEHHEELLPFYDVGREIVTYTSFDDLLGKIRWLLSDPEKADGIRRAGRERALREHTWEMRFEKIFRMLGVLE